MEKIKIVVVISACLVFSFQAFSQKRLSVSDLESYTSKFSLGEDYKLEGEIRSKLQEMIGDNQFVGIAEVHNSQQLSFFTIGFLELLNERGFNHFAIEMGPNSAQILQEITQMPSETKSKIKALNNAFGKRGFYKIPLVFADKIEEALFIEKASELKYKFWGLDQEYSYSYELLFDKIYSLVENKNEKFEQFYNDSKSVIEKNIFKSKISGIGKDCWFQEEPTLKSFFEQLEGNTEAMKIVNALYASWDIYCKNFNGNSNQLRADYMKSNFNSQYSLAAKEESEPKVFVKLGGVHLTHGISPFGVDDIGKYIHEQSEKNKTGFLSIRHLSRFRGGKDMVGNRNWANVELLIKAGVKNEWTLIDLRPLKEKLKNGELITDKSIAFEINSYDLVLIPPNDKLSTPNF